MNGTAGLILQALAPYKLRKEGAGWRCNSPLRPGSNSEAFTLTLEDDEHGAYFDHVSSERGSLYELAATLGIQTERKAPTATKRAYVGLAEYAEAHHLPAEALTAAQWSEAQSVYDPIHKQERPALAFQTKTGLRYRFLDGLKPYYKSAKGYRSCWYGLGRAIELAKETGQALVLCNGEISTVAAQYHGVAACAATAGEKQLANGLVAELLKAWDGTILLAYDCDETGRQTAVKVAGQLAQRKPRIIDLGFSSGGDLADFCALYAETSVEELARRAAAVSEIHPDRSEIGELADAVRELRAEMRDESEELTQLIANVQVELDRLKTRSAQPVTLSFQEIASANMALIDERRANPNPILGFRSNIPSLDKAIGGFEPEMYVIYGATSMGKSTLAVSFAREFLKQGPGFIATTESHPERWMMKLVGSITKLPSDKIETGALNEDEYRRVREAYDWVSSMGCRMLKDGAPSVASLRAALLSGIEREGYEWVIIDSASKMNAPGSGAIYDITRAVSNGLQSLWQEVNLPFIVTTQVGRDVSERPRGKKLPLLEDGYGGGVIEQNAGVVLGLYNHQYYVELGTEDADEKVYPHDTALVRVLKNRWRGDARISSVRLKFVGGSGFYELDTRGGTF